jgi:hypothetical protein
MVLHSQTQPVENDVKYVEDWQEVMIVLMMHWMLWNCDVLECHKTLQHQIRHFDTMNRNLIEYASKRA